MYTQKAGLSLAGLPPKISHTGRHCVGWHAVVCYGAPNGTDVHDICYLWTLGSRHSPFMHRPAGSEQGAQISYLQGMLLNLFGPLIFASYDNEPPITLFLLPRNESNRFANPRARNMPPKSGSSDKVGQT